MLTRLLYTSRVSGRMHETLVESILEQSRENNLAHGITGVLCIDPTGEFFLQAIEGSRAAVNRLYGNIARDPRHSEVVLLDFAEIEERRFAAWRMGAVDLNKVNLSTILRFSENARLDPYSLSGAAAMSLVHELTSSAAIVSRDGH